MGVMQQERLFEQLVPLINDAVSQRGRAQAASVRSVRKNWTAFAKLTLKCCLLFVEQSRGLVGLEQNLSFRLIAQFASEKWVVFSQGQDKAALDFAGRSFAKWRRYT